MPNYASNILVNVVRTKIPLISISFSSLVLIFVLVLVSSTKIRNVFVIFVIVFVVVDKKHWGRHVIAVDLYCPIDTVIGCRNGLYLRSHLALRPCMFGPVCNNNNTNNNPTIYEVP